MRERVVVAMSGGVDSSVAAALLQKKGYEVIGITMCFSAYGGSASGGGLTDSSRKKPACCGIQAIEDAARVCHKLGIRHYVLNMQKELEQYVIADFCGEYLRGRTPNPCVRCNQYLKFGVLLKKALALDAQYLATGHYARIVKSSVVSRQSSAYLLKKAKDKLKDQSYFLYRLGQEQLKYTLFPLGNYTKDEVRKLAKEFGLPVADKLASQEICFLPNDDYQSFIKHRCTQMKNSQMNTNINPGLIVDKQGNVLGQHKGVAFYTIGQREGLGIAKGYPLHITQIDSKNNIIIVGRREEVYNKNFLLSQPHFILKPPKKKVAVRARIRYNQKESPAVVIPCGNQIEVCFRKAQFAITPGQSAVFYDKDIVLGGGVIDKALN